MWIELSDALPEAFPNPSVQICSVFEAIASASFHGRHVLYGSRKTLSWLLAQELGQPAKAAISRALSTVAERGAIREEIMSRLTIEASGQVSMDPAGHWHAPLAALVGVSFEMGEILAENLRDAEALQIAAEHFKKERRLAGLAVAASAHNGGGAEILHCFEHAVSQRRRFTLAVTDSDKDHPDASAGAPSRGCAISFADAGWICKHVELPCREIENLLPFNLVADSVTGHPQSAELKDSVAAIMQAAARQADVLKYADLKDGTPGRLALDLQHPLRANYWANLSKACELGAMICETECAQNPCACNLLPGLGPQLLQRFLDHCSQISVPKQIERMKTSHLSETWLQIGKEVFDWTLADPPVRA